MKAGWPGCARSQCRSANPGLVLKDLAVRGECGQMQPGPQTQLVQGLAAIFAQEAGLGDEAGDFPRAGADAFDAATIEFDADGEFLADEIVEPEIGGFARNVVQAVRGLHHQFVGEQLIQALEADEADRRQRRATHKLGNRLASRRERSANIDVHCVIQVFF